MKQITKYKMTKQTFNEYLAEGILCNPQNAIYHKNRAAIIHCDGHVSPSKKIPVQIEVSGYYPQPTY